MFEEFPVLETSRLRLRAFKESDAHCLYKIRSNDEVMKYMDTPSHKSINTSKEMIKNILSDYESKDGLNWAICEKDSDEMIGYVGFWRMIPQHLRAEIGYALRPAFWKQGLAKEAIDIALDFGFQQLRLHSVEANVNPANIASIILLKKLSFVREAYFRENYIFNGKFLDSVVYSLLESDYN